MTADAALLVRSFRVGQRTVTWTVPPMRPGGALHMAVEWHPDMPRQLTPGEWSQYRAGRGAVMRELVQVTGVKAAVVEL